MAEGKHEVSDNAAQVDAAADTSAPTITVPIEDTASNDKG
jgi:hypothetical protein